MLLRYILSSVCLQLSQFHQPASGLNHLPIVPHICFNKLGSIGSGNGLSSVRHHAITATNADLLLIGTNFSEIWIKILNYSFTKMHLKMFSKWWPFCLNQRWHGSMIVLPTTPTCPTHHDSCGTILHMLTGVTRAPKSEAAEISRLLKPNAFQ